MDEDHKVHYQQPPIKGLPPRGAFIVPKDVIAALGGGDPEIGNAVLLDLVGAHPMAAPHRVIHADAMRELGNGNIAAGRKVLTRFVAMLRKQHTTEGYAKGGPAKLSKAAADYRQGSTNKQCSQCRMFERPDSCTLVKGKIDRRALCNYFERR